MQIFLAIPSSDVNDNAPVFAKTPYEVTVPEVSWFISRTELIISVVKEFYSRFRDRFFNDDEQRLNVY